MKLITDTKEFDKAVTAWGARGKKWADEGHILAMSALTMMSKHNDIGPVNRLYLNMPKGTKSAAMVAWFLAFGAIVANEGQDKADKPLKYTKDKQYNLEDAAKNPWFNFKPEPKPDEVFDLAKAVEQVIKRAQGKQLVHGELLTGLQGLVAMVHAGGVVTTNRVGDEGEDSEEEQAPEGESAEG